MGISFHPDNPFVQKIYADLKKVTGVLLKVKVKKIKDGDTIKREVIATTVLGRVKQIYKFESMGDFQYLPIKSEENSVKCLLEEIIPKGTDAPDFLLKPATLFLPPPHFTRSDRPTNYCYAEKKVLSVKSTVEDSDDGVHNKTRLDRVAPYNIYSFNLIDEYPTKPNDYFIKQINEKKKLTPEIESQYEIVKKLFEERPMWSLNMLKYTTKFKMPILKQILPCFAFFLRNGPWRVVWVKYGYDPRKEPGARLYQTLDFRLRSTAGVRSLVMPRDQIVNFKKADRVRASTSTNDPFASGEVSEGCVVFRPGLTPAQRQIFYQYCDIKIPEVQELISKEPVPGSLCHQKRGWLPHGTGDLCRDHMFKYLYDALLATHNSDVKFEGGSSDDDQNSEGDGSSDSDEASSTVDK